jgi:membrane-bound ClpP family serine protease
MLFLFRGHNGELVRAIVGAVLVVIGIATHAGAIFAGIGVVLLVWGGIGWLSGRQTRSHGHIGNGGRMA